MANVSARNSRDFTGSPVVTSRYVARSIPWASYPLNARSRVQSGLKESPLMYRYFLILNWRIRGSPRLRPFRDAVRVEVVRAAVDDQFRDEAGDRQLCAEQQ